MFRTPGRPVCVLGATTTIYVKSRKKSVGRGVAGRSACGVGWQGVGVGR